MKYFIYSLLIILIVAGCAKQQDTRRKEKRVVARINENDIYISEIDARLEKRLYDILFEIYLTRQAKIEEVINEKIIKNEAEKHNLEIKEFMDSCVYEGLLNDNIVEFAKQKGYNINGLDGVNINTPKGKQVLKKTYKEYALRLFLDSIKKKYNISTFLQPPAPPKVDMTGIGAISRGNLNSKVVFWELSDFECGVCQKAKPIYNKIYEKYKDKVKFSFTYYSGEITTSSVALECSRRQGKVWEMYNCLNSLSFNPDKEQIYSMAQTIDLDMEKFKLDFQDSTIYEYLMDKFEQINKKGIYGTPTILINNRKIFDAFSENEIENAIKRELSQVDKK